MGRQPGMKTSEIATGWCQVWWVDLCKVFTAYSQALNQRMQYDTGGMSAKVAG